MSKAIDRNARAKAIVAELAALDLREGLDWDLIGLLGLQERSKALMREFEAAGHGYSDESRAKSLATNKRKSAAFRARIFPILRGLRKEGVHTINRTIELLDARGVATFRGPRWTRGTVHMLLKELDALDAQRPQREKRIA